MKRDELAGIYSELDRLDSKIKIMQGKLGYEASLGSEGVSLGRKIEELCNYLGIEIKRIQKDYVSVTKKKEHGVK